MEFDKSKFKEMVHYVCRKMASEPEKLGAVKLHKILWYSEGHSYRIKGHPIAGETYIKHQYGPFSTHLDEAVKELQKENRLTHTVEEGEFSKHNFIGKGETDKTRLTEKDISIIDSYIEDICQGHTAFSVSEKSHDAIWKMAEMYEEIPFEAIIARLIKPNADAIRWAKEEASRLGLM